MKKVRIMADKFHVLCWANRPGINAFHAIMGGIFCLLMMTGCGAVPQPFREAESPLSNRMVRGALVVPSIQGLDRIDPGGMTANAIRECIIQALIEREIPAAAGHGGQSSSYLQGQLLRYQNGVGIFEWQFFDSQSSEIKRFNAHIPGISRLSYHPTEICQTVAEQVEIAIKGDQGAVLDQAIQASRAGPKKIYMQPVEGVSAEQARAMALLFINAAQNLDMRMIEDPQQADYYVVAQISEQSVVNNMTHLQFDWFLKKPTGDVLGDMQQANQLPPAEAAKWRNYYPFVAESAAQGIRAMVQELKVNEHSN